MRLAHKKDPGGSAEGAFLRRDVLDILYKEKVSVIHLPGDLVLLKKGETEEIHDLPDVVMGSMIKYLCRKLDIDHTTHYNIREMLRISISH